MWCVSGSGARGKISLSLLAGVLAKRCGGWRRSRSPRVRANRSVVRAAITSRSVRVSRIAGGNALRAQPEPVGGGGKGGGSGVRRTRSAMVKQNFICWQQVQYFFGFTAGAGCLVGLAGPRVRKCESAVLSATAPHTALS